MKKKKAHRVLRHTFIFLLFYVSFYIVLYQTAFPGELPDNLMPSIKRGLRGDVE